MHKNLARRFSVLSRPRGYEKKTRRMEGSVSRLQVVFHFGQKEGGGCMLDDIFHEIRD